jgi:hypothetical protein
MAIEQFGESLLASKRDREKKEKRSTLLLGAAKIGIDLYGNSIKKKAEEFASNAQVWSNRVKYKNALDNSQVLLTTLQGSENYGGGQRQWVIDNIAAPKVKEKLASLVPEELYGEDSLGSYTQQQAERMVDGYEEEDGTKVKGMLELLKEAQTAAQNLKGIDDYDAMVQINNNTPKSVADAAYQRLFGKKDAEALQQEAINKIVNSKFSKNAAAAQVAMDAFYGGATVKDSEKLAERFQQAVDEGRILKRPDKVVKTEQVQLPTAIEGTTVPATMTTYERPNGTQYSETKRISEEGKSVVTTQTKVIETTRTDRFGQTSTAKELVVVNLDTGEISAAVPNTQQKPTVTSNNKIPLDVPDFIAESIIRTISTVSSNIQATEDKTGNNIITEYVNNGDDPEGTKKLVETSIINLTVNLRDTTNQEIDFSTASNIATAVAVSDARRALTDNSFFGSVNEDIKKASPQAGFDTPNFITIIEGMALLKGTSNAIPNKEVEKITTALFNAHVNMDVPHPYENKTSKKMIADFFAIDTNIRQEILTSNNFAAFTQDMPIKIDNKEISLYSFLIDTHKKVMKEELRLGVLKETNAVLNYLGSPTAPTPTVGSTAATVSGGVSTDPVSAFNQRRAQKAQEQLDQFGDAVSSTVASAMRQAYPATDRTTGGPTTTRSAVLGAPGTMGAEPIVAKVLNTITDRAGQQQLVENIRPTDTRTTSTPTPGVSNRSLLALPATAKNNMVPEVKAKERKPKPVSPKVAKVFRGLTVPAVEKVREYLEDPNADTSEDVLSDLAKASGYDPEVMKLLRVSYNYEPNKVGL